MKNSERKVHIKHCTESKCKYDDLDCPVVDDIFGSEIPKFQKELGGSRSSLETLLNRDGEKRPVSTLDMKGLMFSEHGGELLFLTKVFQDGMLLGFWSHSPWGTTRNKEEGWAIINPNTMEMVDHVCTLDSGTRTGEFKEWSLNLKLEHGKANFLVNEHGDREWKITESH